MFRVTAAKTPVLRGKLLVLQDYICPLCLKSMKGAKGKNPVLDHDHSTGAIRDVLCRNCNGMEGKIFNLARRCVGGDGVIEFLRRLVAYHDRHKVPQHLKGGLMHHSHKTDEQKRLARNKKARLKRAALKGK